ncbi:GNAT family N-acetyltransferase [Desulfatibacillum aliphaticivorans]|uniref:GNAT family N-acetyltransferase n=1 Tax=Desulfatibacillum aliphaticivorans TaxID=218208 RepID=UPI0004061D4F|nr:GNAT family protein [Desulfatibacillum aliphaticivorans]
MNRIPKFVKGNKIYLREVRESDVNENYYRWMNDYEITRFLEVRYVPHSLEQIAAYVRSLDGNRDEIFLAICDQENDRHIGNIKLGPINWIHGFGDISLVIGEKGYWGKGIGAEAISLVSAYAFNVLNLNKVKAGCYADNKGSEKAFIKAGFSREGVLKSQWRMEGGFQDEILLGLWVRDWIAMQNPNAGCCHV